jgi:wyosine [tRNA(Phe)-imidazoG37] synthetase (radical SAM superfamily)
LQYSGFMNIIISATNYTTMAKFITNIQLQNADEKDYDTLHKELEKELFKVERHAAKSDAFIPDSVAFSREGNITLQDVINSLLKGISKIEKSYTYFIIRDKYIPHAN